MYYCIVPVISGYSGDKRLLVFKARKPITRLPRFDYVLVKKRKSYVVTPLSTITKVSTSAKEYLSKYYGKWLTEDEFRDVVSNVITMTYKNKNIIEERMKLLDEFIRSELPQQQNVSKGLSKCLATYDWIPSLRHKKYLIFEGYYGPTRISVYDYRKVYSIYIKMSIRPYECSIVISKGCNDVDVDSLSVLMNMGEDVLNYLLSAFNLVISGVSKQDLKEYLSKLVSVLEILRA
jgi:hypothetical protein